MHSTTTSPSSTLSESLSSHIAAESTSSSSRSISSVTQDFPSPRRDGSGLVVVAAAAADLTLSAAAATAASTSDRLSASTTSGAHSSPHFALLAHSYSRNSSSQLNDSDQLAQRDSRALLARSDSRESIVSAHSSDSAISHTSSSHSHSSHHSFNHSSSSSSSSSHVAPLPSSSRPRAAVSTQALSAAEARRAAEALKSKQRKNSLPRMDLAVALSLAPGALKPGSWIRTALSSITSAMLKDHAADGPGQPDDLVLVAVHSQGVEAGLELASAGAGHLHAQTTRLVAPNQEGSGGASVTQLVEFLARASFQARKKTTTARKGSSKSAAKSNQLHQCEPAQMLLQADAQGTTCRLAVLTLAANATSSSYPALHLCTRGSGQAVQPSAQQAYGLAGSRIWTMRLIFARREDARGAAERIHVDRAVGLCKHERAAAASGITAAGSSDAARSSSVPRSCGCVAKTGGFSVHEFLSLPNADGSTWHHRAPEEYTLPVYTESDARGSNGKRKIAAAAALGDGESVAASEPSEAVAAKVPRMNVSSSPSTLNNPTLNSAALFELATNAALTALLPWSSLLPSSAMSIFVPPSSVGLMAPSLQMQPALSVPLISFPPLQPQQQQQQQQQQSQPLWPSPPHSSAPPMLLSPVAMAGDDDPAELPSHFADVTRATNIESEEHTPLCLAQESQMESSVTEDVLLLSPLLLPASASAAAAHVMSLSPPLGAMGAHPLLSPLLAPPPPMTTTLLDPPLFVLDSSGGRGCSVSEDSPADTALGIPCPSPLQRTWSSLSLEQAQGMDANDAVSLPSTPLLLSPHMSAVASSSSEAFSCMSPLPQTFGSVTPLLSPQACTSGLSLLQQQHRCSGPLPWTDTSSPWSPQLWEH